MARGARSKRADRLRVAMPIVERLMAQGKACDDVWWSRRTGQSEWYWLTTPFSVNGRGGDPLSESNYRVIQRDLDTVSAYGTDYRVDLWPGGSIHTLMVRADDALALKAVDRWAAALSDYPVADDGDYSELEWEHNHPGEGECYSDDPDCCPEPVHANANPDPDHQGEFGDHEPREAVCDHEWVAGMMIVHPEDVLTVVAQRDIECTRCGIIAGPTGTHGLY